jgi:hypothetical protein
MPGSRPARRAGMNWPMSIPTTTPSPRCRTCCHPAAGSGGFIDDGLAAVSQTRAAGHPERHAVSQRQAPRANVSTHRATQPGNPPGEASVPGCRKVRRFGVPREIKPQFTALNASSLGSLDFWFRYQVLVHLDGANGLSSSRFDNGNMYPMRHGVRGKLTFPAAWHFGGCGVPG